MEQNRKSIKRCLNKKLGYAEKITDGYGWKERRGVEFCIKGSV